MYAFDSAMGQGSQIPEGLLKHLCFLSFFFLETEAHYVASAGLDSLFKLSSDSQRSSYLCFSSTGIRGVCQHTEIKYFSYYRNTKCFGLFLTVLVSNNYDFLDPKFIHVSLLDNLWIFYILSFWFWFPCLNMIWLNPMPQLEYWTVLKFSPPI